MNAARAVLTVATPTIDHGSLFIPESFTPLFYTPSYRMLSCEQKLRYNQLHALYFNEQIIFFEETMGQMLLTALSQEPCLSRVAKKLHQLKAEEREHSEMFRRLNRLCAPHLYEKSDFYFVQVPRVWEFVANRAMRHPRLFPMFLWLMLLQEERALYYSRGFIQYEGIIEPHFTETQRRHMADESDHVCLGEELIETLWTRASSYLRCINASLFAWMLREFFNTPKRAQLRVVDELAREFPVLQARLAEEMKDQMLALSQSHLYQLSLYSREIVPRTFAQFDNCPEFRNVKIAGYSFRAEEAP